MEPAEDKPATPEGDPHASAHARVNGAPYSDPAAAANGGPGEQHEEPRPARELTMHLLRMLETRMDAAGIALQSEVETFSSRLQLKVLAGAAVCFAVWSGIVLLAIALPPDARVPALAGVVAAFIGLAIWAHLAAKRRIASHAVGSMHWFLESLKLDLEVLSRSLDRVKHAAKGEPDRSAPNDLAH
jgi:uncharacterized membrane protein YqjE